MEKIIKITVTIFLSGILLMLVISACGDKSSSNSSPSTAPSSNNDPDTDNNPNPDNIDPIDPTVVKEAEYPEYCSSTTTEELGRATFDDGGTSGQYTGPDSWVTAQHEEKKWIGWSQNKIDENYYLQYLERLGFTASLANLLQDYDAAYTNYFLTEDLVIDDIGKFLFGPTIPYTPISLPYFSDSAGPGPGIFDGCGHTITFRYTSDFSIFHTNCDPCIYRNVVFDFSGLEFDINYDKGVESNLFVGLDITLDNVGILNKKMIRTYNEISLNGRSSDQKTSHGISLSQSNKSFRLTVKNSFIHIDGIADPGPIYGVENREAQSFAFFAPFYADIANFENVIFVYDTDRTIEQYRYASPIVKNVNLLGRKARFPGDANKSAKLKNIITIGKVVFNPKQDDSSYNGTPIFGFSEYAISPGLFSKFNGTYENIFYDSEYHFTYPDDFSGEKYVTAAGYDRNWIDDQANAQILYPQYKIDSPDRYKQDPAKQANPANELNTVDNRESLWGFKDDVNWHYKDGEYPVLNGHPLSVERQREIINAARN